MSSMRLVRRPRRTLSLVATGLLAASVLPPALYAAAFDESVPTPEMLAELEQRADQADPREQCFLYTELVHTMTEKAGREIASGDAEQASASLKLVNKFAHKVEGSITKDTRKLKDAEELMHHTTFRMGEYLHLISVENQDDAQATLQQLDQVNDELLTQVFRR